MEGFRMAQGIDELSWENNTRIVGRTGDVDPRLGLREDQFPVRVVHQDIRAFVFYLMLVL